MNHTLWTNGTSPHTGNGTSTHAEDKPINHNILLAHAIGGALTGTLFIPVAILLPRVARGYSLNRWWFPVHVSAAVLALSVCALTLVLAKIGLGDGETHGVSRYLLPAWRYELMKGESEANAQAIGGTLLCFLVGQVALGIIMRWYNHKYNRPRNRINWIHIGIGVTTTIIAWATVYTGFTQQWPKVSGTGSVAGTWKILFWVLVGTVILVYGGGWVLLWPQQRRMEKYARASDAVPLVYQEEGPAKYEVLHPPSEYSR